MSKILYFTDDFSDKNIGYAKGNGLTMRDVRAYEPDDFIEKCDAVTGDVPKAYSKLPKYEVKKEVKKPATKKAE